MLSFAWLDRLATPLVGATLRGAIILVGALILTTLLRRRSAAARHAVWAGAIAMQLVVLVLGGWGPQWRVATPAVVADVISPIVALPVAERVTTAPVTQDVSRVMSPAPAVAVTHGATAPAFMESPARVEAASPPVVAAANTAARPSLRTILLFLWLGGAVFVLLRLAVGTAVVATLARRGARVDDGSWLSLTQRLATSLHIDRPLILMRGTRIGVPVTWGIVYPVVLLPDDADAWSEERRRFVLVHEMAHVKRLDALTQLVGQVVLALFWFNPLVWIANRRMQLEREHACDDYVLRHGTAPTMYAEELLAMVRQLGTPEHQAAQPAFAALAMARRSEFEGRMLSILDPVLDRHPLNRGRTAMSILAALLVVVPLAALQPYRASAAAVTPVPASAAAAPADEFPLSFKISLSDAPAQHPSLPSQPSTPSTPSSTPTAPTPATPAPAALATTPVAPAAPAAPATASSPASPSTPTAPAAPAQSRKYDCNSAVVGNGQNYLSIHSDSDDDTGVIDYLVVNGTRCAQANVFGHVTFTTDESDVAAMAEGSHAFFRERTGSGDRAVTVARINGALLHSYVRDGRSAPYDDEARRWLAGFLPTMLAEANLNVKPRVERWRAQGGVDRVLRGIGALSSSGAKVAHYDALLDGPVTGDELDRVVRAISRDLSGSSGDMRSALTKVAPELRRNISSGTIPSLMAAISAIPSSGDRTSVLRTYSETDSRELLLALMKVAEGIPSSGDKASFLRGTAARYVGVKNDALRDAWFAVSATIPSSGDTRNVLATAVPYASEQEETALLIIRGAARIPSSSDRASVLVALAHSGAVKNDRIRDAYMKNVSAMSSSSDMRRALEAVSRQ